MAFDSRFLNTLERLYLLARKAGLREEPGERRSVRRGASIEFADYRHYVPGDEIRYIDWNVYARHGALFVKEFSAEEATHVVILLDASASMAFGDPPKLDAAREVAAALGYVGLVSFDTVSLLSFSEHVRPHRMFLRGKPRIFDLLSGLDEIETGGRTNLHAALSAPLPQMKGRTLILLVTDCYDEGYAEALRRLRMHRHVVHLVHVVSSQELEPSWRGRQLLLDLESGARRDVVLTPERLERYRRRFARFCGEVERFCATGGVRYARVRSDAPLEERVMEILRRGGMLELR